MATEDVWTPVDQSSGKKSDEDVWTPVEESKPSVLGSAARATVRGVFPAITGAIGTGLGVIGGGLTSPVTGPVGPIAGAVAGGYAGATLGGKAEDWLLDKLPESARKALGQDPEQIAADTREHEIAAGIGEFAPQLAVMGPGKLVGPAAREGASLIEKVMSHPVGSRLVGAALGAGQVAGGEAYEGQEFDPTQIALGGGFGALLDKPTKLGERLMMMPGSHGAPQSNTPSQGDVIGVPQEDGTVQHHFVEGVDPKTGMASLNPMTGEDPIEAPIGGLNHVQVDPTEQIEIKTQRASQLRSEAEKEGLTDAERNSLLAHADRLDPAMPTSGGEFVRILTNPDDFFGYQGKGTPETEKPDTVPDGKPVKFGDPTHNEWQTLEHDPSWNLEKNGARRAKAGPQTSVNTSDEFRSYVPPAAPESLAGNPVGEGAWKLHHYIASKLAADGYEHMAVMGLTDGTPYASLTSNNPHAVLDSGSLIGSLNGLGGDYMVAHSHGDNVPLSGNDHAFVMNGEVKSISAVQPDGSLSVSTATDAGKKFGEKYGYEGTVKLWGALNDSTFNKIDGSVHGKDLPDKTRTILSNAFSQEIANHALASGGFIDYHSTRDVYDLGHQLGMTDKVIAGHLQRAVDLSSAVMKDRVGVETNAANYKPTTYAGPSRILGELHPNSSKPAENVDVAGRAENGPISPDASSDGTGKVAGTPQETGAPLVPDTASHIQDLPEDKNLQSKRYIPPSLAKTGPQPKATAAPAGQTAFGGHGAPPSGGGTTPPIPGASVGPSPHTPPPGNPAGRLLSKIVYSFARNEEDNMNLIRGNNGADSLQGMQYINALPKEVMDPKIQEKFYFHMENGDALTPHEQILFDRYIKPLGDAAADTLNRLRKAGFPVSADGYVHRIVVGQSSLFDPKGPAGAQSGNPMYGRTFSKNASGAMSRTLFMAEGDHGTSRIVNAEDYKPGDSFEDNGEKFNVRPATTREIEANSDVRYYHNALLNTMDNLLKLRAAERNSIYLEHLKQDPTFQRIALPPNASKYPPDWVQTKMPQFNGWRMDPKFAHVLDDYYGRRGGDLSNILEKANHLLVSGIFLNPVSALFGHGMNVATHWFVDRGWENFMPHTWARSAANGMRAIRDVSSLNQNYINMMRQGSALMYAPVITRDYTSVTNSLMHADIQKNPTTWGQIAKSAGLDSPVRIVKGLSNISSKGLWFLNDVLMLQRVYDLQSKGMGAQAAIKRAEKGIPNYRIPAEAWNGPGGRAFSELMQNSNLTIFGRYRYGVIRAYAETLKSIGSKNSSYEERMDGIGQMLALGALVGVLYPMADSAVQSLTGNKDASVRKSGPATLIDNARMMSQNEKQFTDTISGLFAPAPASLAIGETVFNRQLWNGHHIYNPDGPAAEKAKELGYYWAGQFSPVQEALKTEQGTRSPSQIAEGWVGVRNPAPGQKERTNYYNQKEGRTETGRWQRVENRLLAPFRQNDS